MVYVNSIKNVKGWNRITDGETFEDWTRGKYLIQSYRDSFFDEEWTVMIFENKKKIFKKIYPYYEDAMKKVVSFAKSHVKGGK